MDPSMTDTHLDRPFEEKEENLHEKTLYGKQSVVKTKVVSCVNETLFPCLKKTFPENHQYLEYHIFLTIFAYFVFCIDISASFSVCERLSNKNVKYFWNTQIYLCSFSSIRFKIIYCLYFFSQKKNSKVYFYASFLAYFLGLLLTILVMHFFKHAQVSENFLVNLSFRSICFEFYFHRFHGQNRCFRPNDCFMK